MERTSQQVVGDVIALLKGSELDMYTNGQIYREGTRPRGSRMEDMEVIFTTGLSGQIQSGVVTILVFVPDITPFSDGVYVVDGARCERLEGYAQRWVDSLRGGKGTDYKWRLQRTIQTGHDEGIHQGFVSIKLQYDRFTI